MHHLITDLRDKSCIVTNGQGSFIRPDMPVTRDSREHNSKRTQAVGPKHSFLESASDKLLDIGRILSCQTTKLCSITEHEVSKGS